MDSSCSDLSNEQQMYKTTIFAEKVIQVHKLIYNNMQSMSVDLRGRNGLSSSSATAKEDATELEDKEN